LFSSLNLTIITTIRFCLEYVIEFINRVCVLYLQMFYVAQFLEQQKGN
jgi:hypothetical protein